MFRYWDKMTSCLGDLAYKWSWGKTTCLTQLHSGICHDYAEHLQNTDLHTPPVRLIQNYFHVVSSHLDPREYGGVENVHASIDLVWDKDFGLLDKALDLSCPLIVNYHSILWWLFDLGYLCEWVLVWEWEGMKVGRRKGGGREEERERDEEGLRRRESKKEGWEKLLKWDATMASHQNLPITPCTVMEDEVRA